MLHLDEDHSDLTAVDNLGGRERGEGLTIRTSFVRRGRLRSLTGETKSSLEVPEISSLSPSDRIRGFSCTIPEETRNQQIYQKSQNIIKERKPITCAKGSKNDQ